MMQMEQVESGRLVRCSTPQMTAPFIRRILRVVEQNQHTVVVDLADANPMTIINRTG